MENCIFCKIIKGEIPNFTILEDERFISFLDINPRNKAQTIVIPKRHIPSKFGSSNKEDLINLISFTYDVVHKLQDKLKDLERCQIVVEGFEIDHLHIKIYPAYFPKPGKDALHIGGQSASMEELKSIHSIINSNAVKN